MPSMCLRHWRWKLLRRFSCFAYVVHASLSSRRVLRTQAWYIGTLVFSVNMLFSHTLLDTIQYNNTLFIRPGSYSTDRHLQHNRNKTLNIRSRDGTSHIYTDSINHIFLDMIDAAFLMRLFISMLRDVCEPLEALFSV